jgi:hypothetical protein
MTKHKNRKAKATRKRIEINRVQTEEEVLKSFISQKRYREALNILSNKVKQDHLNEINRHYEEPVESEIQKRKRIKDEKRMKNERILKRRKVKEYLSLMSPEELDEYTRKKKEKAGYVEFKNPWSDYYYDEDYDNDGDDLSDISDDDFDDEDYYHFNLYDDSEDTKIDDSEIKVVDGFKNIKNFDKMKI